MYYFFCSSTAVFTKALTKSNSHVVVHFHRQYSETPPPTPLTTAPPKKKEKRLREMASEMRSLIKREEPATSQNKPKEWKQNYVTFHVSITRS